PLLAAGLIGLAALIGTWIWRFYRPKKKPNSALEIQERQEAEAWIEKAQHGELAEVPENGDDGSGPGHRAVGDALDWIDPHRHNESS
ncbi:MAG TPA: hypothetical protein VHY20_05530, partial [Pirellulales bacterium]|nr:hypothetical protein [Pirellulales bacterium]